MTSESILKQKPLFLQLIFLVLLIFVSAAVFASIALVVLMLFFDVKDTAFLSEYLTNPRALNAMKAFQGITSLGTFLFPALAFAYMKNKKGFEYLQLNRKSSFLIFFFALLAVLFSLPFIHYLLELNQQLGLPEYFEKLENWMKLKEADAERLTKVFLQMPTTRDLLINLLIIAIIPAIGEELLFRGVLQRLFGEWFKNSHAGVWIAAILFSAIHIQFYGFFPRMVLGAIFGYLFLWSGNLWIPIFCHFINNGLQVLLMFFHEKKLITMNVEDVEHIPMEIVIIFSLFCGISLFFFKKIATHAPAANG